MHHKEERGVSEALKQCASLAAEIFPWEVGGKKKWFVVVRQSKWNYTVTSSLTRCAAAQQDASQKGLEKHRTARDCIYLSIDEWISHNSGIWEGDVSYDSPDTYTLSPKPVTWSYMELK